MGGDQGQQGLSEAQELSEAQFQRVCGKMQAMRVAVGLLARHAWGTLEAPYIPHLRSGTELAAYRPEYIHTHRCGIGGRALWFSLVLAHEHLAGPDPKVRR